ncbi:MAG: hypothetical protein ACREXR_11765 [Gammaproteobacteria bacterium]
MRLVLQDLFSVHPALRGYPVDLSKHGALALQRAGHTSPARAGIDHDGLDSKTEIEWLSQAVALLDVLDSNRVTEDGAEAVALTYANAKAGWVVKRRLQRGESADWLLHKEAGWLALEVSGMIAGDPMARLREKKQQVARCSLPADRLAIVVALDRPLIVAGSV